MRLLDRLERRWEKALNRLARRRIKIKEEILYQRARLRAFLFGRTARLAYDATVQYFTSLAFGRTKRRTFRTLLLLSAIGLVSAVAVVGGFIARDRFVARLVETQGKAMIGGDNPSAISSLRWLVWLDPINTGYTFSLSQALASDGQHEEANKLLDRLTPSDGLGYPPAYLARAKHDVTADDVSPERLERIELDLERLADFDAAELNEIKIQLWLRMGRFAAVDALLSRTSMLTPAARLMGARAFASLGMRASALKQASLARQELTARIEAREMSADRLLLAEAHGICGEFGAVEQVLRAGWLLHPGTHFVNELCRLHVQLSQQAGLSAASRMQLVETALGLLTRTGAPSTEQHYLLYQLYTARGDTSRAGEHLSKAASVEPAHRMEVARFLFTRGGEANARDMVERIKNECLAQLKESPYRRGTRLLLTEAQVFLGDYEGAATSLAEAYDQIADPAYAVALHRTYLAWWDAKTRGIEFSTESDLEVLEKAAHYCPRSLELIKRLHDARRLLPHNNQIAFERLQSLARYVTSVASQPKL